MRSQLRYKWKKMNITKQQQEKENLPQSPAPPTAPDLKRSTHN
jgi:hypothetical protein